MAVPVRLQDIVDDLEMQMDEYSSYLNPETGEIHSISRGLLERAETDKPPASLPKWQEPEWEAAKAVVESGTFLKLPSKWDIHEWQIMADFAHTTGGRIREDLLDTLHGSGAFGSFKKALHRNRMQSA